MDYSFRKGEELDTSASSGLNILLTIDGQALDGKDVKDLLLNVGSGGGAAAAPAAGGAAAASGDAPSEDKKEEKKEEAKEESDEDMGFGLFD